MEESHKAAVHLVFAQTVLSSHVCAVSACQLSSAKAEKTISLQECQITPCLFTSTGAHFGSTSRLHLHLLLLLKHEKKTQGDHPALGLPQSPSLPPQPWSLAWTHKEQSQSSLFLSF